MRNAVAESENIVAETAEKIFADLADAQTINRDKNGAWKAPLWQALTEAGLPLAWVPEDCGGTAVGHLSGRLRFGAGENLLARRRNDGGAREPEGPHHAQCRWQPVGQG